jgi:hypothetical protein
MNFRFACVFAISASLLTTSLAVGAEVDTRAGAEAYPAKAIVVDFNGLGGANGSPFGHYREHGFHVLASKAGSWLVGQNYGDPAPFIYFISPANNKAKAAIRVTRTGNAFSFKSIALYSSITDIPYVFRGFNKGVLVFTQHGTVPNTFGDFATVDSKHRKAGIDTLEVTLTNPAAGGNPVGLDNIAFSDRDTSKVNPQR